MENDNMMARFEEFLEHYENRSAMTKVYAVLSIYTDKICRAFSKIKNLVVA
jgi:hypothetical protein